jgi:hypothetical protein
MAEVSSSVKTVIEVLHDGHEGFARLGEPRLLRRNASTRAGCC